LTLVLGLREEVEMKDSELYEWAHTRARHIRALYVHAAVYLVVMVFLVIVNAITRDEPGSHMYSGQMYHRGDGDWWVIWPALAWSLAVAIHGIVVALGGRDRFDRWEDRKVAELVRRERERTAGRGAEQESQETSVGQTGSP